MEEARQAIGELRAKINTTTDEAEKAALREQLWIAVNNSTRRANQL